MHLSININIIYVKIVNLKILHTDYFLTIFHLYINLITIKAFQFKKQILF